MLRMLADAGKPDVACYAWGQRSFWANSHSYHSVHAMTSNPSVNPDLPHKARQASYVKR